MATYFLFSAGASIALIGSVTIVGWLAGIPQLTTWGLQSIPMAPATAMLSVAMGALLMLCAPARLADRCIHGLVLSTLSLVSCVGFLVLRESGRHLAVERLGLNIAEASSGGPVGVMSPVTLACFVTAAMAFIVQSVSRVDKTTRLIIALTGSVAVGATGFASLLTTLLGYPLLAGSARIPVAGNTSVVLLILASGLAAVGIRLFDRSGRRAAREHSWRPLGAAFVVIVSITIIAGYAFYRQEEQQIGNEARDRLSGITLIRTVDAGAVTAREAASGKEVSTRPAPDSEWTLVSVSDGKALTVALWARLRWVLAMVSMLLISAGAILALVWRNNQAERYWERANLAEAVRLQADRINELMARSPAVLYTLRVDGSEYVPTDMSTNVERILGYSAAEALAIDWFPSHLFPGDREAALAAIAALETTDQLINEFRFVRKDGSVLWVLNQMTVNRREAGRPAEITGAWHDITERRKAEAALRESEERLRLALAAANQGLWDLNVQTGEAIVSPEYATMLGYDADEFHESRAKWLDRLHPDDREPAESAFRDYLDGRTDIYQAECRQRTQSGDWKWILSRGRLIARTPDGQPQRMLGIHTDIHARKVAELRSEALLKEVHHRVKNNLQVISSLLRLERDRHGDALVKSAMSDMQLRILSMALLHESLYKSHDLGSIDLATYLADLAHQVFRSAAPAARTISLRLNLASVLVDMDLAIPCGLLVNEVLSNCLKHAFPDGREGSVTIDLQPDGHGSAHVLTISDTGVGLPADFETRRTSSLGAHLIEALAQQLRARLNIDAGPGASFSLAFNANGAAMPKEPS